MNRRDIIIIAVLVNLGIFAVLFMTATNLDEPQVSSEYELTNTIVENPAAPMVKTVAQDNIALPKSSEEIERVLDGFAPRQSQVPLVYEEEAAQELEKELALSYEKADEEADEGKFVEITIKRGDSLDKIARANGTTIEAIKKANHMNSDKLILGKTLLIPIGNKVEIAKKQEHKPQEKQAAIAESDFYTIQSGDNPWKIAKKFGLNLDDLLRLNNIDENSARRMKAGDTIRIK